MFAPYELESRLYIADPRTCSLKCFGLGKHEIRSYYTCSTECFALNNIYYVVSISRRCPNAKRATEMGSSYHIHRGGVLGRIDPAVFVNQIRSSLEGISCALLIRSGRRGTLVSPHDVLVLKPLRGVQCSLFTASQFSGEGKLPALLEG